MWNYSLKKPLKIYVLVFILNLDKIDWCKLSDSLFRNRLRFCAYVIHPTPTGQ